MTNGVGARQPLPGDIERRFMEIGNLLTTLKYYVQAERRTGVDIDDLVETMKYGVPAGDNFYWEKLLMMSMAYFTGQRAMSMHMLNPLKDIRLIREETYKLEDGR